MENRILRRGRDVASLEMFLLGVFILFVVALAGSLYYYMMGNYGDLLKKTLVTIARNASVQIDGDLLSTIQVPEDMSRPEFSKVVSILKGVKNNTNDISYVYLMRKTDNPNVLSYIAENDSLTPPDQLDANKNGVVDATERPTVPGERYDVSNFPMMQRGFIEPSVDQTFGTDQWGTFISGYAPVYDSLGRTVAIVGVDLRAEDYYRLQQRTTTALLVIVFAMVVIGGTLFVVARQHRNEIKLLKELDLQKSDFVSLASHQLYTPLSSIKWMLNDLKSGGHQLTEVQRDELEKLSKSNERMIELVNNLLKVSRFDSGHFELRPQKVEIKSFCESVVRELESDIAKKGVNFSMNISGNASYTYLDPALLREILMNLLSNAVKYTPTGKKVQLAVKIESGRLLFRVQDEGVGINADEQKTIFSKFYRAQSAIQIDPNGTGLGLFFTKKVVDLMGGEINFVSEEGKGSDFNVYLPIKK